MKKLLLLLVILFTAIAGFAQRGRSILKVKLNNGQPVTVSIDNRYYNKQGRVLTIGDLPAGRHFLKIYRYRAYRDDPGGRANIIYSGTVKLPANTIVTLTYDPDLHSVRLHTDDIQTGYQNQMPADDYADGEDRVPERSPVDDVYSNGKLTQKDMNDLKAAVDERITDTDKQKLVGNVIDNRSYTTEQVRTMMSWLSFESSRLDLAKQAYKNVSDKQNYWKLEKEFTFNSSKDEFNNYIRKK